MQQNTAKPRMAGEKLGCNDKGDVRPDAVLKVSSIAVYLHYKPRKFVQYSFHIILSAKS